MFFSPLIGIPSDTIKTNCVSSENETNRDKYQSSLSSPRNRFEKYRCPIILLGIESIPFNYKYPESYPLLGCPQSSHQDDLSKRFDRQTFVIHQSFSFLERAKEK